MILNKEQLEAGLRACNHYAESYPDEFTPELSEFILALEKELTPKKKCSICFDKGYVTMTHSENGVKTIMGYAKCLRCNKEQ